MKTYKALAGEDIKTTAEAMVKLARETNETVECDFNAVMLRATAESTSEGLIELFDTTCDQRRRKFEQSPAGKAQLKRRAEHRRQEEAAAQEPLAEFTLKDDAARAEWTKHVEKNSDSYGEAIIRHAARWARLMEQQLAQGKKLEEIAEEANRKADKEGITGFMYGAAVAELSQLWIHGEQLRQRHNGKYNHSGEGDKANARRGAVINPAILTIGRKEG